MGVLPRAVSRKRRNKEEVRELAREGKRGTEDRLIERETACPYLATPALYSTFRVFFFFFFFLTAFFRSPAPIRSSATSGRVRGNLLTFSVHGEIVYKYTV